MFGLSLGVLATHLAAALGGGVVGAWFHNAYLKFRSDFQSEDAIIKAHIAALEAAIKAEAPK